MGKQIFLLSVDGGGVRGKIVATFLALLEKDLGATIYNTFDFFAGTSTGEAQRKYKFKSKKIQIQVQVRN